MVGSLSAVPEVQQWSAASSWTRTEGWPVEHTGPWTTVFDVLDPVRGGLDRQRASDFDHGGRRWIIHIAVTSGGYRRSSTGEYSGQQCWHDRLRMVFE